MTQTSLKERTARGLLWGGLSNTIVQALGAVFGMFLMRWLTPEDWGKVAMLYIFSSLASTLQESGFIAALCNRKSPSDNDYNAVFWLNIIVSVSLYVILWVFAPCISWFYGDPDLTALARFLFLGFLLSGMGTVQRAYLFGHMMVRETSICAILGTTLSGCTGMILAYNGFAHWGIVAQQVTYVLFVQLFSWYFSPWRPSLRIDLRPAWEMFSFSSKLLMTNVFRVLYDQAFSVLLGKWFGAHQTGVYSTARKWNDMASGITNGMVSGVAQPTLAHVQGETSLYVHVFRKMMRFVSFVCFPAMMGLGIIAEEFIILVGGEKWAQSGHILSLLCIYGAFVPVTTLYSNLTISRGRSGVNMACTVGQCLAVWMGLFLLHRLGFQMVTMVWFFIALNIIWLGVWQWWAKRLIGLRWRWVAMDILPFLGFTLAVLSFTWWITGSTISNLWLLMLSRIVMAAVLYAGIMWASGAKIMREATGYLLHKGKM